jgi:hypothetical protein
MVDRADVEAHTLAVEVAPRIWGKNCLMLAIWSYNEGKESNKRYSLYYYH